MAAYDHGPLSKYNSLTDRHLVNYFSNDRMRRHLIRSGLVTKNGEVIPDAIYRVRVARREHRKKVRDMIAHAIIHKALEMERTRQIDIRKQIEEIARKELVLRVRADRTRGGDEDYSSYFQPGNMDIKNKPALRSQSSLEEFRLPSTADEESRKRLRKLLPNEEIETKHLSQLDEITLHEYARIIEKNERKKTDHLPYLGIGAPASAPRLKKITKKDKKVKKKKKSIKKNEDDKKSDEKESSNKEEDSFLMNSNRTSCSARPFYATVQILFHAPTANRSFNVVVEQQPSGGNTLTLYNGDLKDNEVFEIVSKRHKVFPFSLTFYIDGITDCRLSTCCEYRNKVGKKLGGPKGHFSIFEIKGAKPCYRCLAEQDLKEEKKPKKKEEVSSDHETITVKSDSSDEEKSDDEEKYDSEFNESKSVSDDNYDKKNEAEQFDNKSVSSESSDEDVEVSYKDSPKMEDQNNNAVESDKTPRNEDESIIDPIQSKSLNKSPNKDDNEDSSSSEDDSSSESKKKEFRNRPKSSFKKVKEDESGSSSKSSGSEKPIERKKDIKSGSTLGSSGLQEQMDLDKDIKSESSSELSGLDEPRKQNKRIKTGSSSEESIKQNKDIISGSTLGSSGIQEPIKRNKDYSSESSSSEESIKQNIDFSSESSSSEESIKQNKDIISGSTLGSSGLQEPIKRNKDNSLESSSSEESIKPNKDIKTGSALGSSGLEEPIKRNKDNKSGSNSESSELEEPMKRNKDNKSGSNSESSELEKPMKRNKDNKSGSNSESSELKEPMKRNKDNKSVSSSDSESDKEKRQTKSSESESNYIQNIKPINLGSSKVNEERNEESVSDSSQELNRSTQNEVKKSIDDEDKRQHTSPILLNKNKDDDDKSSTEDSSSSSSENEVTNIQKTLKKQTAEIEEKNSISSENNENIGIPKLNLKDEEESEEPEVPIPSKEPEEPQRQQQQEHLHKLVSPLSSEYSTTSPLSSERNKNDADNVSTSSFSSGASSTLSDNSPKRTKPVTAPTQVTVTETVPDLPTPPRDLSTFDKEDDLPSSSASSSVSSSSISETNVDNNAVKIELKGEEISFKKAQDIVNSAANKSIQSLYLRNCELQSYVFDYIAEKLTEYHKNIKVIGLSNCEIEISLLNLLAKQIPNWPSLHTIVLSNNQLTSFSIKTLLDTLKVVYTNENRENRQMKLFDLSNCQLEVNDLYEIGNLIESNIMIESIILSGNKINDMKLWQNLLFALKKNKHVKKLVMENCGILPEHLELLDDFDVTNRVVV